LVKINASGMCHTELHFLSGLLNLGIAPMTLGHEIAGAVESVGAGADRALVGRRVLVYYYAGCGRCQHCLRGDENLCDNLRAENGFITDGGYAEYVAVPARNAVPLPDNVSDEAAAPIGCSVTTAVHAVRLGEVGRGDFVLVYGIGAVGFGLVQLAKMAGATVVAVGRTEAKLNLATEMGAQYAINASAEEIPGRIRDITGGHGADVVFELVGTTETMNNSMQCLAKRGRLVFIGYSQDSFMVHPILLVIKEAKVIGSVGNTLAETYEAVRLVSEGRIKTVVDCTLKLAQFQEGVDRLSAGRAIGRIVLQP
jgi:alcohol dehydrogenase, propanol-preferring